MAPSPIGLARRFEDLVAEQPGRFSGEAMLFREVEPTYLRALIAGLAAAVEKEQAIAWEPVVELSAWVTRQPVDPNPERRHGLRPYDARDVNWRPARREIGRLIGTGMKAGESGIPLSQRAVVWNILNTLCDDQEPTAEGELTSTLEPLMLAMNTVRGVALNLLTKYGLWVRRRLAHANPAAPAADFNTMPELRERLEIHLDRNREPTLMARTSYGQSLPWLHLLDPLWTEAYLTAIFPREKEALPLRRAAWISYACSTRAYDDMLFLPSKRILIPDSYRGEPAAANPALDAGFGFPGSLSHLRHRHRRGGAFVGRCGSGIVRNPM